MRASLRSGWIRRLCVVVAVGAALESRSHAENLPVVLDVEFQPVVAQVKRVIDALEMLGQPLDRDEKARLTAALDSTGGESSLRAIQNVLDARCLIGVEINAESRVKSAPGPARPRLVQNGWTVFLVKVDNQAGVTAELAAESPNAAPLYKRSTGRAEPQVSVRPTDVVRRWADVSMFNDRPLKRSLSGLRLEYRIVQIYSRDSGKREASISFNVGQGTQDLGFRSAVDILFTCEAAVSVVLDIRDSDGRPSMASFVIRDGRGRVYPSPSRRLAPDFFFHPQIYRQSGESVSLPPGTYRVEFTRGPEYVVQSKTITVPETRNHRESFFLRRWIQMSKLNWYSGDHHVHAAGCAALREPDRRGQAAGHVAPDPRRRPGCRLRAVVGTVLVCPKAVFRWQDPSAVDFRVLDAL